MKNNISVFKGFLWEEKNMTIEELYKEGAKTYFGMVRHISNDYITKREIREESANIFDQFLEQSGVQDLIEDFCKNSGIDYVELVDEIEKLHKKEIMEYILNNAEEIARVANDTGD